MVRLAWKRLRQSCDLYAPNTEKTQTGHAGAMLQARRLGKELLVGIHSDEAIMDNKGPTVMTLKERLVPFAAGTLDQLAYARGQRIRR